MNRRDMIKMTGVNLLVGALFFPSLYFVSLSKVCIFVPNNIINNKINRLLL